MISVISVQCSALVTESTEISRQLEAGHREFVIYLLMVKNASEHMKTFIFLCSSNNMIFHIFTLQSRGKFRTHSVTSSVEQHTGIAQVMGSNPVQT